MSESARLFEAAKASLIGDRDLNQDRCLVLGRGDSVLLGLADGLGGHPRGEVAAQLLVDVCDAMFRQATRPIADPERFMLQCIGKAHQAIRSFGRRQSPPIEPRTTAVLALIQSGVAHWAHVGDSRLYLLREGRVHHRTRDHAQTRFVRQSAEEVSQPRSSLTRCLGGLAEPPLTTCGPPTRLQPRDTLLLCSDGLWGQVTQGALAAAFADARGPLSQRLEGLMATAADHPFSDNVTAIALRWLAAANDGAPVPTPETTADQRLDRAVRHLHDMLGKADKNET